MAQDLENILDAGGSRYTVATAVDERKCLQERVDETVRDAAERTMATAGRAGDLLRGSWNSLYGREPNPSHAYREAVRAIEAAAIPVVLPADATATLGKLIAALRDGHAKFTVALTPSVGDPIAHVVALLELVWKSQLDRHGTADPDVPISVSHAEAEAALHLATTLVHWFATGVVARR